IGIYRVALKWGAARDLNSRSRLRKTKTIVSIAFVTVGIASLLAFLPHAS
ncbi:MAG: fumarate reductase cytochrome b subunit, partial [Shewanella sp.]